MDRKTEQNYKLTLQRSKHKYNIIIAHGPLGDTCPSVPFGHVVGERVPSMEKVGYGDGISNPCPRPHKGAAH